MEEKDIIVGRDISDILDDLSSNTEESTDIEIVEDLTRVENYSDKVLIEDTPFGILKYFATQIGIKVKDKPKSGCSRCYGRGFTAIDTKSKFPIACRCIFEHDDVHQNQANSIMANALNSTMLNRIQKRQMAKNQQKRPKTRADRQMDAIKQIDKQIATNKE